MTGDRFFTRAGATIAYQVTGSGAPVGYAHGVPLSREAVRRTGLFDVDALAQGRRLLVYDQRGHGHSTGRPVAEDYRFDNVAEDLLGLLDAAGIDQPIDFAGSSLGAAAALHAALKAPERFRRLVLLIPPVAWETGPGQVRQWYLDAADNFEAIGASAWREQWASAEPLPIFAGSQGVGFEPDIADDLIPHVLRGVGASDLPDQEDVATLRHPTLILAWDTDPLHPVSTARRLHELIPGSELQVARAAGEVMTWTRRATDFLAS